MLIIDCCVRGDESWTRKYYQAYLKKYGIKNADYLFLADQAFSPIDQDYLAKRDALRYAGAYDNALFDYARQFRDADEILVAAPYWDLSFPALLKVYLEHVAVCDLTFGYDVDGKNIGFCKANRLLYFSSCGGYVGPHHLGFEYVKSFAEMLGINNSQCFSLEAMDIDPSQREKLLADAVFKL